MGRDGERVVQQRGHGVGLTGSSLRTPTDPGAEPHVWSEQSRSVESSADNRTGRQECRQQIKGEASEQKAGGRRRAIEMGDI